MKTNYILTLGILCLFVKLQAQENTIESLNLNLDDYIVNGDLPTGWFKWGDFERTEGELLSQNNYVGKVVSDKKGRFGCVVRSFPAQYKGDSIQLTGYLKTENVKKGYAGLIMRIDNKYNKTVAFSNMWGEGITGTNDWVQCKVTLPLPKDGNRIYIGGILYGKGTTLFDDFEVLIDGKLLVDQEIVQLTSDESLSKGFIKEAPNLAKEIDFSSDDNLNYSLNPLIGEIGHKKIVAIGEDTHGTSEYYKLREVMTKKLIEEKGFNTVILENPYDEIELLVQHINDEDIDVLMKKHLFPIYQTQEMKSFLIWFKENYQSLNISFKGCDDSYWSMPGLLNKELIKLNNPELEPLIDKLKKAYSKVDRSTDKNEVKNAAKLYEVLVEIEVYLKNNNVYLLGIEEIVFNAKNTYANYKRLIDNEGISSRDEIMANRISYIAKDPISKIIVWAHNAHISNIVVTGNEIGLMGLHLKKEFNRDYCSIGLSSFEGTYSYIESKFINDNNQYDEKLYSGTIGVLPNFSWEKTLSTLEKDAYYLNTSQFSEELYRKDIVLYHKLIGYNKVDRYDFYKLNLLKMYDYVLFKKVTQATNPLIQN